MFVIPEESNRDNRTFYSSVLKNWGLLWWLRGKELPCQCRRHGFHPWVGKIPWRRKGQPVPVFLVGKYHGQGSLVGNISQGHKRVRRNSAAQQQTAAVNLPALSCPWCLLKFILCICICIFFLSFTFFFILDLEIIHSKGNVEKGIAIHSCILAWKIPWTEEPGGLQSMGSQRVGQDWARTELRVMMVH